MSTALHADLHFTVPAGSYPSGLYAIAHVRVEASLAASGGGAAFHSYDVLFGEGASDSSSWPSPPLSADIDQTAELVAPGVTLSSPATFPVQFVASIQVDANAPGEVDQSGSSDIAVQVTDISAPPSVTWASDSGVFGAATVPGLTNWALGTLALVLAGTSLWLVRGWNLEAARRTDAQRP